MAREHLLAIEAPDLTTAAVTPLVRPPGSA